MSKTSQTEQPPQTKSSSLAARTIADESQISEASEKLRSGEPRRQATDLRLQTDQPADYDKWFRAEVMQALQEADNPATLWLDNATVMAESARRRADWGSAKAISDSAAHRPER